jgi:AbrB family looped-hinge helix DNA binding protein
MTAATTRLSSKGQVVIPAHVRRALGWRPGEKLSVEVRPAGERALVLRGRSSDEVETTLARGYDWLERNGRDLVEAFHESRRRARARERRRR